MAHWGYSKKDGPDTWAKDFVAAAGKKQTPIDIHPAQAKYDPALKGKPLKIKYNPATAKTLFNNGHSCQVSYEEPGTNLEGGPLEHKYQIAQFHFHWGKDDCSGSEHRVDGHMYASELHLVHWNTESYKTVPDALAGENGLCVLGIFLKAGKEHAGMKKLTDLLPSIHHKGQTVDLPNGFDPASLLPGNTDNYWTYSGSLTTPPCHESVTWVVFKEPIEVSEEQLEKLRSLVSYEQGKPVPDDDFSGRIVENYRPPLPLNNRDLRASFQ